MGGLGNQMFQYALACTMAKRYKQQLKVDLQYLLDNTPKENYTFRPLELGVFNFDCQSAVPSDIDRFIKSKKSFKSYATYKFYHFLKKAVLVNEQSLNFCSAVLKKGPHCFLDGYWASHKYFVSNESAIRNLFTFKRPIPDSLIPIVKQIEASESISVHFRRGDYVRNETVKNYHGTCDLDYYEAAVKCITDKLQRAPQLFIFSDDIAWVKQNWIPSVPHTYIEHSGEVHHSEDMRLMSMCKHNIIANSTYSWWGAWLNKNQNKIVVAPGKWINSPGHRIDDILLQEWIKL